MPDSMIPLGRFRRQVQQYDPVELVLKCATTSRLMDKDNKTLHREPFTDIVAGFTRTQDALVTHHGLAAVVRQAIRNHPWADRKPVSSKDVMTLANNWNNVEDPFPGSGIDEMANIFERSPCAYSTLTGARARSSALFGAAKLPSGFCTRVCQVTALGIDQDISGAD